MLKKRINCHLDCDRVSTAIIVVMVSSAGLNETRETDLIILLTLATAQAYT